MNDRKALQESRRTWTGTAGVVACTIAITLAMALVVGTDGVESPAQAASVTPNEAARVPDVLSPRGGLAWSDYFPNVELTTHNGQQVRFYDDLIKGKVVVINFMYTTCIDS
jgi:cytochrome oxidase Cu insertion factor (SCO1/SenC/PrrC family)